MQWSCWDPTIGNVVPKTKQKKKKSRVLNKFWRGLGSQMGQWVVQEGGWGYEEHSPKIWCGVAECEVSRTEDSEDHSKHKTKQNEDPAKKRVAKIKKNFGLNGARGDRPLSPSKMPPRPALWTTSTSGKALHDGHKDIFVPI